MQNVVLAANGADAAAVDALTQRHAELSGALAVKTIHLLDAVTDDSASRIEAARGDLLGWCRSILLPYLYREETMLYPAARITAESALLIDALSEQLHALTATVDRIEAADAGNELGAAAVSLRVGLGRHLAAEADQMLPYLAFARDATLSQLWARMIGGSEGATDLNTRTKTKNRTNMESRPQVETVTGAENATITGIPAPASAPASSTPAAHSGDHACTCGEEDEDFPELDVRTVPHAIRHAVVFGAVDAIAPGGGLVLVAPHDPLPLLAQIESRAPGRFGVTYLMREPQECRLRLVRQH